MQRQYDRREYNAVFYYCVIISANCERIFLSGANHELCRLRRL